MDAPDGPVEPGRLSSTAAFFTAIAGVCAVCAGLQVGAYLNFWSPWARPLPWVFGLTGAACVWLALQFMDPRRFIPALAGALLLPLCLGGFAWGRWLASGGFSSPSVMLVPLLAAVALLLVALSTRDVLAVARARRAAQAAFADLEDVAVSLRRKDRGRPVVYVIIALVALPIGAVLLAQDQIEWAVIRGRGALAGHSLRGDGFVAHPRDYPYAGSPLMWYLDTEARYTKVPRHEVLAIADRIARDVGWRLSAATGAADPIEGERRLWASGRQQELPLWIAAELRGIHAFYHEESLFSRSFDPRAHFLAEEVHMDCDQLVWFFLHVASKLDLAMSAMPSPRHVYLRYAGPAGQAPLYVETTQFRNVIIASGSIDLRGPAIGESFFIEESYYPSGRGGIWATRALVAAAGLFQPWTERDIRDAILGNVLVGVEEAGLAVDAIAEAEKQVAGSRDISLVANLYKHLVERAQRRATESDVAGARTDALRARALRADYGTLVVRTQPVEEEILDALGP